jgi:hypothetical protein
MREKGSEIRRLMLAKSLYLHGYVHASTADSISRMVAIHHFDNAIEIVLKSIATKRDLRSKKKYVYFEGLLDNIPSLPLKDQMRGLHRLRNSIQHGADIPSMESVVKYKAYTEDFFRTVCDEILNIPYDELFLSDLIENENLRNQVREAEEAFERGKFKRCIELCDDALISATFDEADIFYSAGELTGYWGASEELRAVLRADYPERYREEGCCYELAKELRGAIVQWGQATTGMQFLDEYRADFLKHRRIVETLGELSEEELRDNAEFCLNFAMNLILKWQEEGIFK